MDALEFIWILIKNLYFLWNAKLLMEIFSDKKPRSILTITPWVIFYAWQVWIALPNPFESSILTIVNFLLILLINILSYKGNILMKFILCMLYLSIGAIIEYLLILLIIMMKLDLSNPRIISFFSVISMFITTIFVLALKKYCEKKKFNLVLHNKKKLLTFFIMNAVVFMMQIITASFDIFEAQMQLALLIIISFVIIFQVGTFIMLSVINELDNYKNRHNMYEGNINSMSSQAEAIINANEELKKLRHDLKQHLTTLYGFINASSSYLQDLLNDSALLSLQQLSHTGCIPIDSIINENHRIALAQKINFTMSSNAMPDMSFEHMTLALILGNALENAIEATVKLPEDERYINVFIKFTMKYPKQMLRIKIENSCVDYTKKSRWEQFFTTKNDVENHGIGLSSIKAEVAKYNGSCDLSCENGVFTLDIELISERTIEGAII